MTKLCDKNESSNSSIEQNTLKCAQDALELECRFFFGTIPSDTEFKEWLTTIATNQVRLRAIFEKRNPWILKFAEKIPNFWNLLYELNKNQLSN